MHAHKVNYQGLCFSINELINFILPISFLHKKTDLMCLEWIGKELPLLWIMLKNWQPYKIFKVCLAIFLALYMK